MDWLASLLFGGLEPETREIVKATLGPTVAILLFVATNVVQIIISLVQRRNETRRIVSGILNEIQANLVNSAKLLPSLEPTISAIKLRLVDDDATAIASGKSPTYKPLLGITDSSQFYDGVAGSSPAIRKKPLAAILYYYRCVSNERILVEAIDSYAFLFVSVKSRCEIMDEVFQAVTDATEAGKAAIRQIEASYPIRWFRA